MFDNFLLFGRCFVYVLTWLQSGIAFVLSLIIRVALTTQLIIVGTCLEDLE